MQLFPAAFKRHLIWKFTTDFVAPRQESIPCRHLQLFIGRPKHRAAHSIGCIGRFATVQLGSAAEKQHVMLSQKEKETECDGLHHSCPFAQEYGHCSGIALSSKTMLSVAALAMGTQTP